MPGKLGTIVELDENDSLGWIELDEGGRVRFGGTALRDFVDEPGVGTRVEVIGTTSGYRGVLKATEVRPVFVHEDTTETIEEEAPEAPLTPWPELVRDHPRWSDAAETCVPCRSPAPPLVLEPHPLFAPWHGEICETAPTVVGLVVPTARNAQSFEPSPSDSFAHGRVAFLDEPRWPSCGPCSRPLEMCLQLSPQVIAEWLPGGFGLVAMYCFHCGYELLGDPRIGYVRLVEPRHRVLGPEAWRSRSSGWSAESLRVTARSPRAMLPAASWYRCRAEISPHTASSALIGPDDVPVTGPFPAGVDPDALDDLGAEYDDWVNAQATGERWGGANLGGVAEWNECDDTPSCAHGPMLHLLDYEGGQFLEGALHVFACRENACELSFVAEF